MWKAYRFGLSQDDLYELDVRTEGESDLFPSNCFLLKLTSYYFLIFRLLTVLNQVLADLKAYGMIEFVNRGLKHPYLQLCGGFVEQELLLQWC